MYSIIALKELLERLMDSITAFNTKLNGRHFMSAETIGMLNETFDQLIFILKSLITADKSKLEADVVFGRFYASSEFSCDYPFRFEFGNRESMRVIYLLAKYSANISNIGSIGNIGNIGSIGNIGNITNRERLIADKCLVNIEKHLALAIERLAFDVEHY